MISCNFCNIFYIFYQNVKVFEENAISGWPKSMWLFVRTYRSIMQNIKILCSVEFEIVNDNEILTSIHTYTHTHTYTQHTEILVKIVKIDYKSTKTCLLTKISTSNFFTIPIPLLGKRKKISTIKPALKTNYPLCYPHKASEVSAMAVAIMSIGLPVQWYFRVASWCASLLQVRSPDASIVTYGAV